MDLVDLFMFVSFSRLPGARLRCRAAASTTRPSRSCSAAMRRGWGEKPVGARPTLHAAVMSARYGRSAEQLALAVVRARRMEARRVETAVATHVRAVVVRVVHVEPEAPAGELEALLDEV